MKEIKVKETNEVVYYEKLKNGLEVFLYPNNNVKNTFMALGTKYGSIHTTFKRKDEKEYHHTPNGVAHFLEHITFHLDGMEATELFTPYGARINAFTSPNRTCYVVECNNSFDKCLDNLIYYVYTPYYTEETVKNEKGIIEEESKRCDDDPDRVFHQTKLKALFNKSNYKEKIVGSVDEIESITLDDINNAYNTFYNPGNMFLIISGNFDKEEAIDIINKRMNTFKFDAFVGIDIKVPDEDIKVNKEYEEAEGNVLNDSASYQIKIPLEKIKETGLTLYEYTTYLDLILFANFGGTSDCYKEIIEKDIAPFPSYAYNSIKDDFIIIDIGNKPKEGKDKEYIELIDKYLNNMVIDEKVMERKIKCIISDFILSFDESTTVANNIMNDIILFGKFVDDALTITKNFTVEKGEKILKSIDFNNKSIVILKAKSE